VGRAGIILLNPKLTVKSKVVYSPWLRIIALRLGEAAKALSF
jgi:hypothetical protein